MPNDRELQPQDIPVTPEAVSVFVENGHVIFRTAESLEIYFSEMDSVGKSNCNGKCAAKWHPLKAPAGARTLADWSVVNRTDGSKQWAYKGKPLYTFAQDAPGLSKAAGEAGWHIVKP